MSTYFLSRSKPFFTFVFAFATFSLVFGESANPLSVLHLPSDLAAALSKSIDSHIIDSSPVFPKQKRDHHNELAQAYQVLSRSVSMAYPPRVAFEHENNWYFSGGTSGGRDDSFQVGFKIDLEESTVERWKLPSSTASDKAKTVAIRYLHGIASQAFEYDDIQAVASVISLPHENNLNQEETNPYLLALYKKHAGLLALLIMRGDDAVISIYVQSNLRE